MPPPYEVDLQIQTGVPVDFPSDDSYRDSVRAQETNERQHGDELRRRHAHRFWLLGALRFLHFPWPQWRAAALGRGLDSQRHFRADRFIFLHRGSVGSS